MTQADQFTTLVVGSGGREHTLVKACASSPLVKTVLAAPGNPGMESDAQCFPVAADNIEGILALVEEQNVNFVIVGPEVPLAMGLVDRLADNGVLAYGPKADGAKMEASKQYTKELLFKYNVPTGAAASFDESDAALNYLKTASFPIVVKADGLAAGKGVIIAEDYDIAAQTVRDMLDGGAFGESGKNVLIEECLFGEETSIHVIVSGKDYMILPSSQDHKQVFEGDKGPNTGGMGAYSPADLINDEAMAYIEENIVKPSVDGIAAEGIDFRGTLFIGIMMTKNGPKVLEFNTRFGDPETQVLLPRLETDPVEIMVAAAQGTLSKIDLKVKDNYSIIVVLASKGYPEKYPKGEVITFPESCGDDETIYHAGTTRNKKGDIVTNGGRVLGVTAVASSLRAAADKAYALCSNIDFRSKYLRRDIAAKELNRHEAK